MDEKPIHPADLADKLQRMPVEEAQKILRQLPRGEAAAVVAEIDEQLRPNLLAGMSSAEIARLIPKFSHDTAADVVAELPEERRPEIMAELPSEEQARVSTLLAYPPDTAGGIMSDRFIKLRAHQTVDECLRMLQGRAEESQDGILYLYVTDENDRLLGIVSMRDLIFRGPQRTIGELMNRDVKHVFVDDDQETIARLFEHYHYLALPVLDRAGRLVGVVSAQQVMDVLRQEATEDMQLMVGLSGEERALTPWQQSIRKRLPWLCINLATAFLAGAVVGLFEGTIAKWTALAVFLPIVAGQGGNAGAQTLTVIIREMALGEMNLGDGRKALIKEVILGLLNGLAIGLLVGVIGYFWKGNIILGVVVGAAMLLNMVAAALSGVLVPYSLKAMRIDPALASSIMVTTVTDVAGFFFFLGLAALALQWWPPSL
ncbi:MAG: magnesium transporter [Verrucomicrobia subdivision 3 bacterium]|nr:magnesium transporter [Limisphaerales bacterium]